MKSLTYIFSAVGAILMASCGSYYDFPSNYSGPTAVIQNTGEANNSVKTTVYRVTKIDNRISTDSPMKSLYGGAASERFRDSKVKVAANRPVQVEIAAYEHVGTDGIVMENTRRADNSKSTIKTVTFTPRMNRTYVVRGNLKGMNPSVWLIDESTGRVVR